MSAAVQEWRGTLRPILFTTTMVHAILAGTKTQTRRAIKFQPPTDPRDGVAFPYYWGAVGTYSGVAEPRHYWTNCPPEIELEEDEEGPAAFDDETLFWPAGPDDDCSYAGDVYGSGGYASPYGSEQNCIKPAARLWVRETTLDVEAHGYVGPVYLASDEGAAMLEGGLGPADDYPEVPPERIRLRPSIYMPRTYARLLLEITRVSVERLQDISEEDALAEGCQPTDGRAARDAYARLWDEINGEGAWTSNPFVWVVKFKVVPHE